MIQYKIILCLLGFLILPISGYQVAHADKGKGKGPQKKEVRQTKNDYFSRFPMLSAILTQDQSDDEDQNGNPATPEPIAPEPKAPPVVEPNRIATVTSDTGKPVTQKKDAAKLVTSQPTTRAVTISEIPKLFVTSTSSNTLYEQNKLNPTATKLFIVFSSLLAIGGLVMVTGQPQTIAYRMSSFFSFL